PGCFAKVADVLVYYFFFFSSRRRHTRFSRDWSSDVCSSDLGAFKIMIPDKCAPARVAEAGNKVSAHAVAAHDGMMRVRPRSSMRSEERRVGKECSTRGAVDDEEEENEEDERGDERRPCR